MNRESATMSGAEFRARREALGLAAQDVAVLLDVSLRSVRRWESGASPVSKVAAREVHEWQWATDDQVQRQAEKVEAIAQPGMVTYADNESFWRAQPQMKPWPARWHRGIAARVVSAVPRCEVTYD